MTRLHRLQTLVPTLAAGMAIVVGGASASNDGGRDPRAPRETGGKAAQAPASPFDLPDIFGHGQVLTAGQVFMKVTNLGLLGNPFTNLSSAEFREGLPRPDFHGRETGIRLPQGAPPMLVQEDCPGRDLRAAIATDLETSWFDFDCDYCTGVWDYPGNRGLFHHAWKTADPPVSVDGRPDASDLRVAPNPAREQVGIDLAIQSRARVEGAVFDVSGRLIRGIANHVLPPGRHRITWDLRNDAGDRVPPGLYFLRMNAGTRSGTARILVLDWLLGEAIAPRRGSGRSGLIR